MIISTGSSYPGHGLCCKPGYDGYHCNNEDKNICSPPSRDTDFLSKWADVVSPDDINYQMFAYCPGVNEKVCGISDDPKKVGMNIYAGVDKKTLSIANLKYVDGNISTRSHQACYYQIKPNITET